MKSSLKLTFPSPFEIALLLTVFCLAGAILFTRPENVGLGAYAFEVLEFWKMGFWELLEFTLQMVLILIFGHALAISPIVDMGLAALAQKAKSNTAAVILTAAVTLLAGYINWGFGLILGAVLARKIGEQCQRDSISINYPLVAAAGYVGMLVWHGGFSGSAPLKVAEPNHFLVDKIGVIGVEETLLSQFNFVINAILVVAILMTFVILSKRNNTGSYPPPQVDFLKLATPKNYLGLIVGLVILGLSLFDFFNIPEKGLGFITLNFVNFFLLGLGLCLHLDLNNYVKAIQNAIGGATGIVLQFPFYAGILGVLKYSGLLVLVAGFFVENSSPSTFPVWTFFSAALINLFVPSGGGQWAVQGPVVMEAARAFMLPYAKVIMALAYGDQLSNMLQPFWALPLLAITGVSAKEVIKYTALVFIVAAMVLGVGVYLMF
ncbi:short-chain fatty acid transporter [Litoribacter ruber]|uniref:TIGR00366 family protein n=1 Tax=Litoribacter ruber TaxID=702568 RepID=UPI001BDB20AA|nr:TIGR00366 family protein [Litoribacter ruber]MBT0811803.1 short-chain fatty acid transporter [Litoribacter ruber]